MLFRSKGKRSISFPQSMRDSMKQTRPLWSKTLRQGGHQLTASLYRCSTQARFQSGTQAKYVLLVQDSRRLAVVLPVQSPLKTCSNSQLMSLKKLVDASLLLLKYTTSPARSLISSLWEVYEDQHSSVYLISRMSGCVKRRWDNGGSKKVNVPWQTTPLRIRRNRM